MTIEHIRDRIVVHKIVLAVSQPITATMNPNKYRKVSGLGRAANVEKETVFVSSNASWVNIGEVTSRALRCERVGLQDLVTIH